MVEVGSLNPLMAGLPLELLPQPSTLRIGNSVRPGKAGQRELEVAMPS